MGMDSADRRGIQNARPKLRPETFFDASVLYLQSLADGTENRELVGGFHGYFAVFPLPKMLHDLGAFFVH